MSDILLIVLNIVFIVIVIMLAIYCWMDSALKSRLLRDRHRVMTCMHNQHLYSLCHWMLTLCLWGRGIFSWSGLLNSYNAPLLMNGCQYVVGNYKYWNSPTTSLLPKMSIWILILHSCVIISWVWLVITFLRYLA